MVSAGVPDRDRVSLVGAGDRDDPTALRVLFADEESQALVEHALVAIDEADAEVGAGSVFQVLLGDDFSRSSASPRRSPVFRWWSRAISS